MAKKKKVKKKVKLKIALLKYEIDVKQLLLHSRQLFLYGVINDDLARKINQGILALSEVNNDPIVIWINSPGGSVPAGFSIIDTMKGIRPPVYTFICGYACSMAGLISLAGSKRIMTPNSTWMAHDVYSHSEDYATKIIARTEQLKKLQNQIINYLSQHTCLSKAEIDKAINQELWLNPDECREKGIIDQIANKG